jgi:hypothetical protein
VGTDRLAALVAEEPALHGAKITGGSSGGAVCVLGDDSAAGSTAVGRSPQVSCSKCSSAQGVYKGGEGYQGAASRRARVRQGLKIQGGAVRQPYVNCMSSKEC